MPSKLLILDQCRPAIVAASARRGLPSPRHGRAPRWRRARYDRAIDSAGSENACPCLDVLFDRHWARNPSPSVRTVTGPSGSTIAPRWGNGVGMGSTGAMTSRAGGSTGLAKRAEWAPSRSNPDEAILRRIAANRPMPGGIKWLLANLTRSRRSGGGPGCDLEAE